MEEMRVAVASGDSETFRRCLDETNFKESHECVMAKLLNECLIGEHFKKDMMQLILNTGVNPNIPGKRRKISVKACRRIHHVQNCMRHIESSKYALLVAVQLGNVEAVKLLLQHGANVDIVDMVNGWTALYIATLQFDIQLVEILLLNGAQPNKKVINATPFTFILKNFFHGSTPEAKDKEKILRLMLNYGANVNVLLSYTEYSTVKHVPALLVCIRTDVNFETVKEVVVRVADVDAMDSHRDSPLHRAVRCGRPDLVKLLLENGSNPNLEFGYDGQTCLMEAVRGKNIEVTKLLVEAGANIQAKDALGCTLFSYAMEASNIKAVALLLLYNVKFHELGQKSEPGLNSDLMKYSCYVIQNEEISRLLFVAGANLENVRSKCACTNTLDSEDPNFNYKINEFLKGVLETPAPLKQLCRTIVRWKLSNKIQTEIELLPFPRALKDYILIPETIRCLLE